MCRLARVIEDAIADGLYTEQQEVVQLRRLKIIEDAYARGGDTEAEAADQRFLEELR